MNKILHSALNTVLPLSEQVAVLIGAAKKYRRVYSSAGHAVFDDAEVAADVYEFGRCPPIQVMR